MPGKDGRGRALLAVVVTALVLTSCGARDWRRELLRAGAVNVGEALEDVLGDSVSVLDASFSPDSPSILIHAMSLTRNRSTLWVYGIDEGTLTEVSLKSGWTLSAASFMADSESVIMATERIEPPTFRLYEVRPGSDEWRNLTDLIPTSHVKTVKIAPCIDGETFAVLSVAEGHPDVVVSRSGEILHETQVYPGYVSIVGWDGYGKALFLESDMPLDLGLTMEAREKNAGWDESMREGGKSHVFVLDVADGKVWLAEESKIPDPTISPDGRWKLHVIPVGSGITGLFLTGH